MNRGELVPAVTTLTASAAPVFHIYRVYSLRLNLPYPRRSLQPEQRSLAF